MGIQDAEDLDEFGLDQFVCQPFGCEAWAWLNRTALKGCPGESIIEVVWFTEGSMAWEGTLYFELFA